MKNWKTTLFGVVTAALYTVAQANPTNWKTLAVAAGIGALGFVAKDRNVTGGTVQQ